eukprot:gene2473-2708_t
MNPIIHHLILDRVRATTNLLRKSEIFRNHGSEEARILSRLKELQSKMRSSNGGKFPSVPVLETVHSDEVRSDGELLREALRVYSDILGVPYLSEPYKLSALESLQVIIERYVVVKGQEEGEVFAALVQAVISCKFIQTEVLGDQLVQLHLLQTLRCLLRHSFDCLDGQLLWKIVVFCLSTMEMLSGNSAKKSLIRYHVAEDVIWNVLEKLLQCTSCHSEGGAGDSYLFCLRKLLFYISSALGKSNTRWEQMEQASTTVKDIQKQNSSDGSGRVTLVELDGNSMHILYLLRLLQHVLIAVGSSSYLFASIHRWEEFSEIGHSLFRLGSRFRSLPTALFQSLLSVFVTFFHSLGWTQRASIEQFVKQTQTIQSFIYSICTENYMPRILSATAFRDVIAKTAELTLEWKVSPSQFSEQAAFSSIQKALLFMLDVISSYGSHIRAWEVVLYTLAVLRDHILLPSEMILDSEHDLLPPNIRMEFETELMKLDRGLDVNSSAQSDYDTKKEAASRGSLLSLQLLGEALFGASSPSIDKELNNSAHDDDKEVLTLLVHRYRKRSSRWDAGYDYIPSSLHSSSVNTIPGNSEAAGLGDRAGKPNKRLVWDESLRLSVAKSSICQLVNESKFLPEQSLQCLMEAIAQATELYCLPEGQVETQAVLDYANLPAMESLVTEGGFHKESVFYSNFALLVREQISTQEICLSISASSMSWLEMVLVDLALRNRDRFQICWSILRLHYLRSLGSSSFKLSYVTERQLSGMLKIIARMLSRDHYAATMIELLGKVLAPLIRPLEGRKSGLVAVGPGSFASDEEPVVGCPMTSTKEGLSLLINQVTVGMWRILTQNVDLLPLLSLEQWETIFRVIAFCSSSGSYAAFKSFEIMAWLLHEPRLIANVPVFCIIAVKPLVKNKNAPIFVSSGAVQLLRYLHSRLEALIQEAPESVNEEGYDTLESEEEAAVIWKQKCWLPILQSLAEGVSDDRQEVRLACTEALCDAISDRYCAVVPTGILIDVLAHVLVPVIRLLGDILIIDWHKEALSASNALPSLLPLPFSASSPSSSLARADRNALNFSSEAATDSKNLVERDIKDWVNVEVSDRAERPNTMEVCVDKLCHIFSAHLHKLVSYPSFDKLWLQVLHLFGYFI